MAEAIRVVRVSVEDYLAAERDSPVRHEYVDGELFAMAGAGRAHNALAVNLTRHLANHLDGGPCRIAASDMKVRPADATRFYYPDLVVSCVGQARRTSVDKRSPPVAEPATLPAWGEKSVNASCATTAVRSCGKWNGARPWS